MEITALEELSQATVGSRPCKNLAQTGIKTRTASDALAGSSEEEHGDLDQKIGHGISEKTSPPLNTDWVVEIRTGLEVENVCSIREDGRTR